MHRQSKFPGESTSPLHRTSVGIPGSPISYIPCSTPPNSANLDDDAEHPSSPPHHSLSQYYWNNPDTAYTFSRLSPDGFPAGPRLEDGLSTAPTEYMSNMPASWYPAPSDFLPPQAPDANDPYRHIFPSHQGRVEHSWASLHASQAWPLDDDTETTLADQDTSFSNPASPTARGLSFLGGNVQQGATKGVQQILSSPHQFSSHMPGSLTSYPSPPNTGSCPYPAIPDQMNQGAGRKYLPPPLHHSPSASRLNSTNTAYVFQDLTRDGFSLGFQQLYGADYPSTGYSALFPPMVKAQQLSGLAHAHPTPSDIAPPQSMYASSSYHHTSPPSRGSWERFQAGPHASQPVQSVPFHADLNDPPSNSANPAGHRIYQCQWRNPDGTVCGQEVNVATLSAHLSDPHGIRNQSRNIRLKCQWPGCGPTKTMNRESIRRHIIEIHFGIKRSPMRVQEQRV